VILVIIGFALVMKAGSKFGWLVIAAAGVYAWFVLQPVIHGARRGAATPEQNRSGYYRKP
jgi:hypothetical protein